MVDGKSISKIYMIMSFEDDMIDEGFRDEQNYLDYLMDKADTAYEKQQQDWEDLFEGWSIDDINTWEEEEREKKERKRQQRIEEQNQKIKEDKQLELWKEANPNEAKIWNAIWYISYSRNTEFNEWAKWIDEKNVYRKWKQEHLKEWNSWKENKDKEDFLYEFLNWTEWDEFRKIADIWIDFIKWRGEHIEKWHTHKLKFLNVWKTDDVYEVLAWKEYFYCYSHDSFELWKNEHEEEWEVWKKERKEKWLHSRLWNNNNINLSDYEENNQREDSYLWSEEWYRSNMREYHKWIDNIKNASDIDDILFNLWKEKNSKKWEEWKRNNWEEWRNKIHDLDVWKAWVKEYFNEWKIWADDKLNNWKVWMIDNRELNLYYAWSEYHSGSIDDFRLWKEKNIEDWEIWEKELEDRIYKKKWEEEH